MQSVKLKHSSLIPLLIIVVLLLHACGSKAESSPDHPGDPDKAARHLKTKYLLDSIRVVYDVGGQSTSRDLVIYALPNGNSIEWTMGKQLMAEDDWHFDIQHIFAQTQWLRQEAQYDFDLVYLEAPQKSWPNWKRNSDDPAHRIVALLDTLRQGWGSITLSSHSGGGSLVIGFIESRDSIPDWVERIIFIDSNYGYNREVGQKLITWIKADPAHKLVTFAYNDSIALYQGKPFVSATGGTWYRTKMMLQDLEEVFEFNCEVTDSLETYQALNQQVLIILKQNPDRGIYHTQQVELNGFIHSLIWDRTPLVSDYTYFGERVYEIYIPAKSPI